MWVRKVEKIKVDGLGNRVREARARVSKEKSLESLCEEAGVSKTFWYSVEAESRDSIQLETLRKMEKALGVDLGVNFDGNTK